MTDDSPSASEPAPRRKAWLDYRAVWRWHFYASLFCMPFVIVLSLTGAVYLFKTEIERWIDRPYDQHALSGSRSPAEAQVRAALEAFPGSVPASYELPETPQSAGRVVVQHEGVATRVYVHPETLAILHTIPENERFMRFLFRLHGELLMGDRGSNLVELAASWTILMIVTGLYLWWPRQSRGLGGVLYPRLRMGSRVMWRDAHSVSGFWISAMALFLLATGLPWAKFWGGYFKSVRQLTGTAVAQQDWTTGSERLGRSDGASAGGEHAGHSGHGGGGRRRGAVMPSDLAGFDRVAAAVAPLDLEHPVVIAPPSRRGSSEWTAKSMTPNRPKRVNLVVNGDTGDLISREDFRDRHIIDRVVGVGIAAHEGRLFGWPNQLLGLMTAGGLVLLCVSGLVMWWKRRDSGGLGAPRALERPGGSPGLLLLIVLFGIYLPLFGASLIVVLLVERLVLCRIPGVRRWLGLSPAGSAA
ncbi:MAG: PepSY domain-containing protein [Planctomyces sp.]|nr:PepSY domain-containing protein [Planctomyces sp.]